MYLHQVLKSARLMAETVGSTAICNLKTLEMLAQNHKSIENTKNRYIYNDINLPILLKRD
ncbi:hypothetical protein HanIR_Chr04g0164921 [Helianthus annuus]|nr:hypothetical protein HanIR_Chr04g0164921 [Helianthus annuus]